MADAESIEIPPEALAAIARSATGSFRNALGTLEQLVTYSGTEIALEDALAVLGVADGTFLADTIDAVARGDAPGALRALEQRAQHGNDPASLARDLEARARELLLVQALGEIPSELSLTAEADEALREQAARVGHDQVLRLLELLGEAMEGIRAGADARTRLELALVKASRPDLDGSLKALLSRIERLEAQGPQGAPPSRPSAAAQAPPEVAPEPRVIESAAKAEPAPASRAPGPVGARSRGRRTLRAGARPGGRGR